MSDLDVYKTQNFGNSSGWGRSPALLIVDFVNGFTDPVKFGGGNIQVRSMYVLAWSTRCM